MSKYCPVTGKKVVYLVCQECEDKVCKRPSQVTILAKKTKDETVSKKTENPEDNEKIEPTRGACPSCETCFHKTNQKTEMLFGKERLVTYCEVYRNYLIDSVKVSNEGCPYHNRDMSNEAICMNCESYLGGSDWGLSCRAKYYTLTTALSPACKDFKRKTH